MDVGLIVFFAVIVLVAAGILAIISRSQRSGKQLNVDEYRSGWLKIEQQLKRDEPSSYQLAILNADKLLDKALKERGTAGENMGQRMKNTTFSNANAVWAAHKLRNKIAHETDVYLNYDLTRRAMASFKQALKDVGAI